MTRKHAYLVLAHNNIEQLRKLIRALDYELNDIYLHIDSKSDLLNCVSEFRCNASKLYVIKAVNVHWGGFSQIKAELCLMEAAYQNGPYSRYHLLSGNDIPLMNQMNMHTFFEEDAVTEYIHYDAIQDIADFERRMGQYHFLMEYCDRKYPILYKLDIVFARIQKILGINRLKTMQMELKKGANWFSITQKCVELVLSKKEWIYQCFQHTKCCDEVFLQTIVYNSPLYPNVYHGQPDIKYRNLRLTDWQRGKPYVFRNEDYDMIVHSQYKFARKFDEKVDNVVIDRLFRRIEMPKERDQL